MRRLAPLLLLPLAAPADAQRLPYRPVSDDALAVRLAAPSVADDPAPALPGESAREKRRRLLRWGLLDRFEHATQSGRDSYSWDFSALLGGERDRLWLASVGDGEAWRGPDYLEFHALYSRYVGSNVDLNAGVRWDAHPSPDRLHATLGVQYDGEPLWAGLFAYASDEGELGARLAALYNQKLPGKLVLQPSFELDWIGEDVPELGLGRGFHYAEAGLRLRYEWREALAPYVGLSWERSLGRTARLERAAGEDPEATSLVLGLRSSF